MARSLRPSQSRRLSQHPREIVQAAFQLPSPCPRGRPHRFLYRGAVRNFLPVIGILALLGILAAGPPSASAEPLPAYDGGYFPTINGPADPEEYSWQVELHDGQELRQIDDQRAAIYFEDETVMWVITAAPARDAWGTAVPTNLAVSEGNVVALTVHHREGNPAKDGVPFVYPVTYGSAFEVGYSSVTFIPPPVEPAPAEPPPGCVVPSLKGKSLKADRRQLREAGCRLGEVRGAHSKAARVVSQRPRPGTVLEPDAEVGVKLGG